MARKRGSRTRYRTRTVYKRARTGGGSMKPIIDGVLAGAGGVIATKYLGGYGGAIANLGIGYFRKNPTLKTLGAIQIGNILAGTFVGNGTGGNGGYIA